jgi:hypothetical protein
MWPRRAASVAASSERYDLIQVALLDSFSASSAGLYALSENYLYTVEALQDDLRHLQPGGLLAITRWVALPPRDALKLFGAAVAALERSGVADPGSRLVMVRSWKTVTLLVKNGAFDAAGHRGDQGLLQSAFVRRRVLPPACGRRKRTATTSSKAPTCSTARRRCSARAATRSCRATSSTSPRPPTTSRTSSHFFRWRSLPELLSLKEQGGLPLARVGVSGAGGDAGAGAGCEPAVGRVAAGVGRAAKRTRVAARVTRPCARLLPGGLVSASCSSRSRSSRSSFLFLSHPLYAVAVVLFAFCCSPGSAAGFRRLRCSGLRAAPCAVVLAIGLSAALCLAASLALPARDGAAGCGADPDRRALIAPLAFFMGMPFRWGWRGWRQRTPARSLGLGHQRLRIGHRRGAGDAARDPCRIHRVVVAALVLYGVAVAARP